MSIRETGRRVAAANIQLRLHIGGQVIEATVPADVVLVPKGAPRSDGRPREHAGLYIRPSVSLAAATGGVLASPGLLLQVIRTSQLYQTLLPIQATQARMAKAIQAAQATQATQAKAQATQAKAKAQAKPAQAKPAQAQAKPEEEEEDNSILLLDTRDVSDLVWVVKKALQELGYV
jgi:hypothetical protein